jgi:hypothetical protein
MALRGEGGGSSSLNLQNKFGLAGPKQTTLQYERVLGAGDNMDNKLIRKVLCPTVVSVTKRRCYLIVNTPAAAVTCCSVNTIEWRD